MAIKNAVVIVDDGGRVRDYLMTLEDASKVFDALHGEGQEVTIIHLPACEVVEAKDIIERWTRPLDKLGRTEGDNPLGFN